MIFTPDSPEPLAQDESGLNEIDLILQSMHAPLSGGSQPLQEAAITLSETSIATFQSQTITDHGPGSILKDFQLFLDSIGTKGVPVSSARHTLPTKLLSELNESLGQPIAIAFARPAQKSYPNICGLYLLSKASGLVHDVMSGKKPGVVLNAEGLSEWKELNPTEQYFTLLEAWLVRARPEMLGERSGGGFRRDEGSSCLAFWQFRTGADLKFAKYADQDILRYTPTLTNLALMQLFGLVTIQSAKPDSGKGWRIKSIQKLPWGDAVFQGYLEALDTNDYGWPIDTEPYAPFGALQPVFQPYFPDWQNTLSTQKPEFRPGVHTFKVTLGKAWRRMAIAGSLSLENLSHLILASVDFDSDHLDMFEYQEASGRTVSVNHPYCDEGPFTDEVQIGEIPLKPGMSMTYIFDFGDWWKFQVTLESVTEVHAKADYSEILERHGKAPQQYRDWDDED